MTGARFAFDRRTVEGPEATYAVSIAAPEWTSVGTARLGPGRCELGPMSPALPAWAEETAVALLRTVAKNHAEGDWPRRVHRWRAPRAK